MSVISATGMSLISVYCLIRRLVFLRTKANNLSYFNKKCFHSQQMSSRCKSEAVSSIYNASLLSINFISANTATKALSAQTHIIYRHLSLRLAPYKNLVDLMSFLSCLHFIQEQPTLIYCSLNVPFSNHSFTGRKFTEVFLFF